jgi:hypothetical protein
MTTWILIIIYVGRGGIASLPPYPTEHECREAQRHVNAQDRFGMSLVGFCIPGPKQ